MGAYEKIKSFFDSLRSIYFRVTNYKNLEEQHKTEAGKVEQLALKNKELTNKVILLSEQLGNLETSVEESTEQRNLLAEELATTQAQLFQYQKGVLESPEYKGLNTEKKALEVRVEGLEKQVVDLTNLCMHRQETIKQQQGALRDYSKRNTEIIEGFLQKKAEHDDQEMSYVVIDGNDNIVASTPAFRNNFYHSDIERVKYWAVLKSPENEGRIENWINLRGFLKSQKQEDLVAIITDGRRKPRKVILEKQKPDVFQCLECNNEGELTPFSLVYRRIDIHDIGRLEGYKRGRRTKQAERLNDYAAVLKLNEIEIANAELKKATDHFYDHLKKRITFKQAVEVWDNLGKKQKNYKNWRNGCYRLLIKQRMTNRKKQAKEQKK